MSVEANTEDPSKTIFVFGSNTSGQHTEGDALIALRKHRAVYGRGVGPQGDSYAIPVRDENNKLLPIPLIERYVQAFMRYVTIHGDLTFQIRPLGCGAGEYRDEQIAPLFAKAPQNCRLPAKWQRYLKGSG